MRNSLIAAAALVSALASGPAFAVCAPEFEGGAETVTLNGVALGPDNIAQANFNLRVRNAGDPGMCEARLRISRVGGPVAGLPDYALRSGSRIIEIAASETAGTAGSDLLFNLPSDDHGRAVPFRVQVPTNWGLRADTYTEQLFASLIGPSGEVLDRLTLTLTINIPPAATLRIVGATGGSAIANIDLGSLSRTQSTQSPPFGVRIWSSAPYTVGFQSANLGRLRHDDGTEYIAYSLSMDGTPVDLAGGTSEFYYPHHTPSLGDVHPLLISVGPVSAAAGSYSDRVTVSVTAM